MVTSKFAKRAGILLAGALTLAGCDNPSKSVTNEFVSDLIANTDDLNTILRRHVPIADPEGIDVGIIYISEINLGDSGEYCAKYTTIDMEGRLRGNESDPRTACAQRLGLN